jgi:hypothetical protein
MDRVEKMYANIISQIENGLADWSKDFSEIETPIMIKYVKTFIFSPTSSAAKTCQHL